MKYSKCKNNNCCKGCDFSIDCKVYKEVQTELIAKNKIMKVINKKLGFNILSERYKVENLKIIDDEYSFMYDFTFNKKRYQVEYLKYLKEVDFVIVK